MTGPLYRLAHLCIRHKLVVLGIWLLATILLVLGSHRLGDNTNDNLSLPGTDSQRASEILAKSFPDQANGSSPIVLHAVRGTLTEPKHAEAVERAAASVRKAPNVASVVSPLTPEGAGALSKSKAIGYLSVTLSESPGSLSVEEVQTIIDAAHPAVAAGLEVQTGGQLGQKVSKPSTESSELIGIIVAMAILAFTFGTVVAMLLPILNAIIALLATLSIIRLLGHVTTVPTVGPTLATMIGLGVGIDYALFIVTRHFRGMQDGLALDESIARAAATSGGAVFFAGGTVTIALVSLAIAGIPLVTTMGFMAAIAVVIAVLAALTLLPAVLAIVGPRINSLRVRAPYSEEKARSGLWAKWAHDISKRPLVAGLAALAVLIPLMIPLLSLTLGQQDTAALSTSTTARRAYDLIAKGFGPGVNGPLIIAVSLGSPAQPSATGSSSAAAVGSVGASAAGSGGASAAGSGGASSAGSGGASAAGSGGASAAGSGGASAAGSGGAAAAGGPGSAAASSQGSANAEHAAPSASSEADPRATDPRLQALQRDIAATPGVAAITPIKLSKAGTIGFFNVIAKTGPAQEATAKLVERLRSSVIPKAEQGTNMHADVGGSTAGYVDLASRISSKLPLQILVVIVLSFALLVLSFRTLVIPPQAAIMNLLSIGASYGVLTAIFQYGWLSKAIGLSGPVPIVSYVPLFMFAILFGLSMDYEVFLVSQIEEHVHAGEDNRNSVVSGLVTSARVITAAALIMVFVFGSFLLNGDPTIKQFGVGLAIAIIIDSTIVRCLFVPALMIMMGRINWWLPAWLDRAMPHVSIEGAEYFAERDRAASAQAPVGAPAVEATES
ncbi:MAG TPA: MMPL family transporter [Solirubrobacteraceae bacterium]|jgi:RND superfamily putative drug exporter